MRQVIRVAARSRKCNDWLRPAIAIPAHGEEIHLSEHYDFACERQVPHVIKARNGDVVLLGPGEPGIVGEAAHGRLFKDGNLLVKADDEALRARQSLAFGGIVTIALAVTSKGDLAGTPDVVTNGLPARTRDGGAMDALVDAAMFETFENLPRQRRRDADTVSTAIERAVRSAVNQAWGKRPSVHVWWWRSSAAMIGRLNHVAMAVRDLATEAARYRDVLGAVVSEPRDMPEHGVTVVFIELENTKIELMTPLDEASPIAAFIARTGGGMHHICYEVDDISPRADRLIASGTRILGDGEPKTGAHGKPVLFLHPRDFAGTLIELEQV